MINAIVNYHDKNIVSVIIKGHSGYSDYGSDIICSAVTAVSECIANGITEILKVNCNIEIKEGYLLIDIISCNLDDIKKCQILLETLIMELNNIEFRYKKYIKVTIGEV